MTHPRAKAREIDIQARRAKVTALLLAGVTNQTQIAEQLEVDQSTISRDIKAIEKQWQAAAVQDISAAKGKDLQRTERLIQALWQDAIKGKWLATDRVISLMQHRAKLLGLESPAKQEVDINVREHLRAVPQSTIDSILRPADDRMNA